ncbi:MAG: hypothetical protein BA861_02720 [Desulfobacterales bacterium S3730MH5]|nr:MAG: hypothetical protein BA861_02720 [Desulfobacterales bacterium S3730MH5]
MIETVLSKNEIPIPLTDERWTHITEEHCELAGMRLEVLETIANPFRIVEGGDGELLSIREIEKDKFLVVVCRELNHDVFIITAFLTRRIKSFNSMSFTQPNLPALIREIEEMKYGFQMKESAK